LYNTAHPHSFPTRRSSDLVIETHPHADFVSSHLEIHETTGATIYVNSLVGAQYPHQEFDDGDAITVGNYILEALFTPGHSPDSKDRKSTRLNSSHVKKSYA